MYTFPGHVAFGLYIKRIAKTSTGVTLAATILPDVVDKTLSHLFPSVFPYGRNLFHSLVTLTVITLLIFFFCVIFRKGTWRQHLHLPLSWALGHISHLIGDFSFIPTFYPIISYSGRWPVDIDAFVISNYYPSSFKGGEPTLFDSKSLVFESLFFISSALLLSKRWKGSRPLFVIATLLLILSLYFANY